MLATRLWQILPLVFVLAALLLSLVTSIHAILHKRDPRAAVSWTGLIWLVPIGGALLYGAFGINRIARRAGKLRDDEAGDVEWTNAGERVGQAAGKRDRGICERSRSRKPICRCDVGRDREGHDVCSAS